MTAVLAALALRQAARPLADMPFVHEPGRIWLKVALNGALVDAMLDSGASESSADLDTALKLHATKGERFEWTAAGGDRPVENWEVDGLHFQFQDLPYPSISFPVRNAFKMSQTATPGGKVAKLTIGLDLFRMFTVAIDYSANRVRLYSPATYRKPDGVTALKLEEHDGIPIASARLRLPGMKDQKVTISFDTGSPIGLVVTHRMVRREDLAKRYADRPAAELRDDAMGGRLSLGQVDGIQGQLGDIPLNGTVFLALSEGGGFGNDADADLVAGDELLRHLDIVFDLPHSRMFVKLNGK